MEGKIGGKVEGGILRREVRGGSGKDGRMEGRENGREEGCQLYPFHAHNLRKVKT